MFSLFSVERGERARADRQGLLIKGITGSYTDYPSYTNGPFSKHSYCPVRREANVEVVKDSIIM